jgi:hypothetical protein
MNVLAKTKKFFPGPIKGDDGKVTRHPTFQVFLCCWNALLASTTEQVYNELLEEMRIKHPVGAMSYCESTWLLWKEKLVLHWINQSFNFGVTVTSPNEGCHATLKLYLQRGHGDLRGVFLKMKLFWTAQYQAIQTTTAQQQLRPKHSINIPLFAAVLQHVHGYALQKILQEHAKLPATRPPPPSCICSISQSIGLPCYHTIWERKRDGGVILLEDIHPHWYYIRPESCTLVQPIISLPLPILNPMLVKGKGRPKGALGNTVRATNTRRDLSAWELPSSSAPVILQKPPASPAQLSIGRTTRSSTAIAMARLANGHQDPYEPGRHERAYMHGISSIYQTDSTVDATIVTAGAIQGDVISGVEVYTQDAEV